MQTEEYLLHKILGVRIISFFGLSYFKIFTICMKRYAGDKIQV